MTEREGRMTWGAGHETWYRIVGAEHLDGERAPAILAHGGPGATHDYVLSMAGLADERRACVLYDQVGNGRSSHHRDAAAEKWTEDLFAEELERLVEHVGVEGRYHVVGQSWGGMLAMLHALRRPAGLRSIVVADSPASIERWVAEANRLREALPPEVQETLLRHEEAGTTDHAEYQEAMLVFYRRHVCRLDPWPDEVKRSFAAMEEDPTVYGTMNGPSEFHVIGPLRDFDITDRLGELDLPVLLVSGRHDEATPELVGDMHAAIPGSRWELFEDSSHMPHVEERERFLAVVGAFLAEQDAR